MRLGHFDLNLFVALDALLETRSVTQAGKRLHLGASATSSALGRLRAHFGDELLVQVGRRMELTPLAQQLCVPVRDILLRSQAALFPRTGFDPGLERRCFRLNASGYATLVLLGPLIRMFDARAPGLSVDVLSLADTTFEALERGDVDMAIFPRRNASPDHPWEALHTDGYSCVVWNGSELGEELGFEQYMAARHVAAQFGDSRVPTFESWFLSTHGVERRTIATVSSFNSLAPLIVGTQCIATMHTRLAELFARTLPVRLLKPPLEIPPLEMVMQWNRYKSRDPGLAWLRGELKQIACEVDAPAG